MIWFIAGWAVCALLNMRGNIWAGRTIAKLRDELAKEKQTVAFLLDSAKKDRK